VADLFIAYDPEADAGERLAPEVRTEIAVVAPSAVLNGSITTAKLADDAVTQDKIYPGAVGSVEIATGGVSAVNIATDAVSSDKIAAGAVVPASCGTGVPTAVDNADNPTETIFKFVTAAEYGALTPDPNTVYLISA